MSDLLKPALLAISKRGELTENLHYGWICVLDKNKKIIFKSGKITDQTFLRSCAKPIQAISTIDNNPDITEKELAIISGSHSGSKKHIELLTNFLKKNNLTIQNLKCGLHLPFDEDERKRLLQSKKEPSPLHNNCSGKHLGMLSVCKKKKWDFNTYLSPNHPLQKIILKNIEALAETKNIHIATDGCGLPTFALPIINIAKIFSNFTLDKKYFKIITSMKSYPYLMGGKDQIDSEIIKASNRKLISKVGAEGIIIVAYEGNSLVVKITDGNSKIRSLVVLNLLIKLGWLKKQEIKDSILEEIYRGEIKNHGEKVVGKVVCYLNSLLI
ncbi:MAG: asparaginase [Candidatus Melainabacteria bacterium]|nr:asparaginase [Candidatus Melainabacteria bacterium]